MTSLPRYTVGAFVYAQRNGRFLALCRAGYRGAGWWGPPGGAVEAGETFEEAAVRELREEAGLDADGQLHLISATAIQIDSQAVIQLHYACRCADGEVELSREHSDFRWVTPHEYRELVLGHDAHALARSADAHTVLEAADVSLSRYEQWLRQESSDDS